MNPLGSKYLYLSLPSHFTVEYRFALTSFLLISRCSLTKRPAIRAEKRALSFCSSAQNRAFVLPGTTNQGAVTTFLNTEMAAYSSDTKQRKTFKRIFGVNSESDRRSATEMTESQD